MANNLIERFISSLIILPIALLFIINGSLFFIFFLGILFFVTSYEWIRMSKKKFLYKIFCIIFLILSFYSAFLLRDYAGLNFFLFIILISIFTDIGGYIFGKFFKGPKLTKISPNKTYSGAIGSLIMPVFAGLLYIQYFELPLGVIVPIKLDAISNNFDLTFLIMTLSISIISQLGDLTISYFKRLSKIKDTGKILPGHGGLLDRVDGLIFVIPTSYLFIVL
jgi:phosphatidate cytidylyltransferase